MNKEIKIWQLHLADLQAMPQKTVRVHNEPALSDLLAGYTANDPSIRRAMLHSYVHAEGTDKYWVLYSVIEIEQSEHEGDVIVAIAMDGKPLGGDGQFKLVSSEDKKPQRWVRNLTSITVRSTE